MAPEFMRCFLVEYISIMSFKDIEFNSILATDNNLSNLIALWNVNGQNTPIAHDKVIFFDSNAPSQSAKEMVELLN